MYEVPVVDKELPTFFSGIVHTQCIHSALEESFWMQMR